MEAAYEALHELSESVEARMADAGYPEHIADVRAVLPDWLEHRRRICESFDVFVAALQRCNGKAGGQVYLAHDLVLDETLLKGTLLPGHHARLFEWNRKNVGVHLDAMAHNAGEK
jgi:hypothetical protein